ncbi:MAG: ABC transporter permease [Eubacteriales bacterium]
MLKAVGRIFLVLIGISFISFLLIYMSPGDPVRAMFAVSGNIPAEEVLEEMREELGLNRPFLVQYGDWLLSCFCLDFGTSYSTGEPVLALLIARLWPTLKITGLSLLFMTILAIPLGLASALHPNSWLENMQGRYVGWC